VFDFDGESEDEPTPQTGGERLFLFIFCALFFGGLLAEVLHEFAPTRLSVIFFLVFWCLLTIAHEAGHALVARACGWRVDEVQLGFGPIIGRYRPWGLPVELRAFPIVGLVSVVPTSVKLARLKNMLIYGAGPAVELAIALLVGSAVGWDAMLSPSQSVWIIAAQSLALAAVFGAGLNLLPFSPQPGVITDGLGVLLSPFLPRAHFEGLMVRPILVEGNRLITRGRVAQALLHFEAAIEADPGVILLHVGLARARVKQGRTEEALLGLQALLTASNPDARPEVERALGELRTFIERERGVGVL
jgi:Zn-dependent protease